MNQILAALIFVFICGQQTGAELSDHYKSEVAAIANDITGSY